MVYSIYHATRTDADIQLIKVASILSSLRFLNVSQTQISPEPLPTTTGFFFNEQT